MVTSWIMIMDLINEMHILRWHLKTNIVVLFTLPMIPLFILIDSELHVMFIQIYAFKHEQSTVQPNLPPCVVALPAFAASRRRNCAFLARQPRTMASARQPQCCLVTNRIPSWTVTTDPYDSTLHSLCNEPAPWSIPMCNIQFPSAFTIHLSSDCRGSILWTSSHPQFFPTFTTAAPISAISLHSQRWRLRPGPGPVASNRPYFAPCVPIHHVSPELEPEVDDGRWRIYGSCFVYEKALNGISVNPNCLALFKWWIFTQPLVTLSLSLGWATCKSTSSCLKRSNFSFSDGSINFP